MEACRCSLLSKRSAHHRRGEPFAWQSFILPQGRAEGSFLKFVLVWFPPSENLSKPFHFPPLYVSCDHFIPGPEKTASVIAHVIGKHGSPGGTCRVSSCQVACNSRPPWHHIIPKMALVRAFHFPITVLKIPHLTPGWFQWQRLRDGGEKDTPAATLLSLGCVCVCACTHMFANPICEIDPGAALCQQRVSCSWESAQSVDPLVLCRGPRGGRISQRLRVKSLIGTGKKNNETTRSQIQGFASWKGPSRISNLIPSWRMKCGPRVPGRLKILKRTILCSSLFSSLGAFNIFLFVLSVWCLLWESTLNYTCCREGKHR